MSADQPIGVGIIGLGFMGRTHLAAYQAAAVAGHPVRVAGICDRVDVRHARAAASPPGVVDPLAGPPLPPDARWFDDAEALLYDDRVDLVSICTPTDSHVALASAALRAGKDVLLEKPVALRSADVRALLDVARQSTALCMPAMCVRFWPAWLWLKERIAEGSFGRLQSLTLQRLAARPSWSTAFYQDTSRSGGALIDLHIHDADFVLWCLGSPRSVLTHGSPDHFTTVYRFADGPAHVLAQGCWAHAAGTPFRMRFTAAFERATAEFDLSRAPQLLLSRDGASRAVPMSVLTGYDGQVRHMLGCLRGQEAPLVTLEDALRVAQLLEHEQRSLQQERAIDCEWA